MKFIAAMLALVWSLFAFCLVTSPIMHPVPACFLCAAVIGCGYFCTQSRDGDAEDAEDAGRVYTVPAQNPYALTLLDENRDMDHTEKMYDHINSLQCRNSSTADPLDKPNARTDRNATHDRASRYQSASRTTEGSQYYIDSERDWEPEHEQSNAKSRTVTQSFQTASYSRNVMRDDAVRNVLGWNAVEDEERGRMLPVSSGHTRTQKTPPYNGQARTAVIPAPVSKVVPQSPTDNGKNGQAAIGYMREIYNMAIRLYDCYGEELGGHTFWSQCGADPDLTKYMRQTRFRIQTIMKWTSIGEDQKSPDFDLITSQDLQHTLRLTGEPFDNLLKIFMQGATCMGSTSDAGYAYDQLRKADAFFKQWSPALSTTQQHPAGLVLTSTQDHASGDSRSQVHAEIATAMFKIHEAKRAIISGLKDRSTDQAAWQAAFSTSDGQTFSMTVQNTMRGVAAWASVQGTLGQADPSKLQLHEMFTLGLMGQEFDELRELFHLAAQNIGTNHVLGARDALVGATQFFSQWLPAPAPGRSTSNDAGSQPPQGTQPTQQPSGPNNSTNGTGSKGSDNQPAPSTGAPAGQAPSTMQSSTPPIALPAGANHVANNQQQVIKYIQAYINAFGSFPSDPQQALQALNDPQWTARLTDMTRDLGVIKQWACANLTKKSDSRLPDDTVRQSGFRSAAWKATFQPLFNLCNNKQGTFTLTAIGGAGRACKSMDEAFGMYNVEHAIN